MKRILVLSDSHGNVNNMVTAVGRLHPDMIIHLGDCWADAEQLHRKFPMTVMEQVPGNCDCRQEVQERILLIEGKKILICHGHTFNVKAGYLNLQYAAEERKVDAQENNAESPIGTKNTDGAFRLFRIGKRMVQ